MNDTHDDFDRRMRAVHARAVAQVPSRLAYQLRSRRVNAATAARPAQGGAWWLAAAAAAVFALAIGLRLPALDAPAPAEDLPPLAAVTDAVDDAAFEDSAVALEEDPDLYLWLAAQDSQFLAME